MHPLNVAELLESAAGEIERLRRTNELLQAQVAVINVIGVAMEVMPRPQGFGTSGPDLAWNLRHHAERQREAARAAGQTQAPGPLGVSGPSCDPGTKTVNLRPPNTKAFRRTRRQIARSLRDVIKVETKPKPRPKPKGGKR